MEGRVDNGRVARGAPVTGGVPRGGPGRPGRMVLLALLLVVVGAVLAAAVLAAPALAQVAVGGGADTQDPIPDFVFEEDGALGEDGPSVVIDGDGQTDCRSFASFLEEGELSADADTDLGQARRVLEQCEEAGLLDSGGSAPPSSPDPATADATAAADTADEESATATAEAESDEEPATASASPEPEALPDTGGVSPAPLTVLPALLLAGAGVMAVRAVRRD